jgi:hypothetical protein
MRRGIFILGTGAAIAALSTRPIAAGVAAYADLKNGQFGADVSGADLNGVQRALSPDALVGTVMSVQNAAPPGARRVVLDNLPTISTQGVPGSVGDPGSCEAQSFGYCLGAYTAARNPDGSRKWSAGDPANQPSAAWLYQWAHQVYKPGKTCPSGSPAACYAIELVTAGAPSTATDPYNPSGATTVVGVCSYIESLNVTSPGPNASRLLVGSYKAFPGLMNQRAQYLDTFKALIRNGHAIAFSGRVAKEYCIQSPPLVNGAFTMPKGYIAGSGHGQVIVGYDDSKGPRGAFLVQNSFGPGWNPGPSDDPGRNGRIWWGYEAWFKSQSYAIVMYPNLHEPPFGHKLHPSGGSGAVNIFVRSAKRYSEDGKHYAILVLHANAAITLSKVEIVGKNVKIAGETSPTAQAVAETMRFGYTYVRRATAFPPGEYDATLTTTTEGGQSVTYRGPIEIT